MPGSSKAGRRRPDLVARFQSLPGRRIVLVCENNGLFEPVDVADRTTDPSSPLEMYHPATPQSTVVTSEHVEECALTTPSD